MGAVLLTGVEIGHPDADLDEAIAVLHAAIDALPEGPPALAARSNLGAALRRRFEQTSAMSDLHAMIAAWRHAVDATPSGDHERVGRMFQLGVAYQMRFAETEDEADLELARALAEDVVAATAANHPDRPGRLSALGLVLCAVGARARDSAALDEAVARLRDAVAAEEAISAGGAARTLDGAGAGQPRELLSSTDLPTILQNLSTALHSRFMVTGAEVDLREAIDLVRRVLAGSIGDVHRSAKLQTNLSSLLLAWSEIGEYAVRLDEAADAAREAIRLTAVGDPRRVSRVVALCGVLRSRYRVAGEERDLEEARVAATEALAELPSAGTGAEDETWIRGRTVLLSDLATTYEFLHIRRGERALLEEAIRLGRAAVEHGSSAAVAARTWRALPMSRLGGSLRLRHDLTGDRGDLDEAVEVASAAVAGTSVTDQGRAVLLSNLGNIYRARYLYGQDPADINEAVRLGREALATGPAHGRDRHDSQVNLAVALLAHAKYTKNTADLDEAVALLREVVAAAPDGDPYLGGLQTNLALALHTRFGREHSPHDLDEAIRAARSSVQNTPHDQPDRAGFMTNLCQQLKDRFDLRGDQSDLDEMLATARSAAALPTAPTRIRTLAALIWAQAAARDLQWAEAADGYSTAVSLLARLAPRSLAEEDQERLLGELAGVGLNAAAGCVRAGQPERAVELFEQGRAIMLGQALDTRTDLTALAERHPQLASQFTALAAELDHVDPELDRTAAARAPRRRQAATAFEDLIDNIRTRPGFERFLRPRTVEELRNVAAEGPIVMIVTSPHGCYALILTTRGVDALELATTSFDEVAEQSVEFLTALAEITERSSPQTVRRAARHRIDQILAWEWTALVGPVLDHLDLVSPPAEGQPWPRVWWCPSGPLAVLPLHAAGQHETRGSAIPQTALDRVISSYTPTIRALDEGRRRPPVTGSPDGGLLAVSMATTPNLPQGDLPGADKEVMRLRERYGSQATVLAGSAATRDAVTTRLQESPWVHFACHGVSAVRPLLSQLLLHDHDNAPFTAGDVIRLRLDHAEIAYLSACSTARPGPFLLDESIHLASAFQLAGYRHVVGTLWPISDDVSVSIADDIYSTLESTGGDVALAVHLAARTARSRGIPSSRWAAYIHNGG